MNAKDPSIRSSVESVRFKLTIQIIWNNQNSFNEINCTILNIIRNVQNSMSFSENTKIKQLIMSYCLIEFLL